MDSTLTLSNFSTSRNNFSTSLDKAAAVPLPASPKPKPRKIRSVPLDVQGNLFIAKINTESIHQELYEAKKCVFAALKHLELAKQTCSENITQLRELEEPGACYTYYAACEHEELIPELTEAITETTALMENLFGVSSITDLSKSVLETMEDVYDRAKSGTYLDTDYDSDA
jgi:hypothetical protein